MLFANLFGKYQLLFIPLTWKKIDWYLCWSQCSSNQPLDWFLEFAYKQSLRKCVLKEFLENGESLLKESITFTVCLGVF